MSGHSKWHNIQARKGKQDAKRAGAFTKLARGITTAAREGGGDPAMNFKLRIAVDKAKAVSMPKEGIERAIAKGTGAGGGAAMSAVSYEAKGPGNIDIIVDTLTDNKNRTASEIKHIFTKNGGIVGAPGSVSWNFVQRGYIVINPNNKAQISNQIQNSNDQEILEIMDIDGVEDVEENEGEINIYTAPKELAQVVKGLEGKGFKIEKAELIMDPKNTVKLDEEKSASAMKLLELLDDYDDTENVWTNLE
ncbi:MAG TPA: YebC/PmpR family DNA-binding transcriptional regulator [Patescibacteria group bacterium]|nr:YebC/PmpR family DNA-binding transcriptional regulator [Patescibacteria group bacterium]